MIAPSLLFVTFQFFDIPYLLSGEKLNVIDSVLLLLVGCFESDVEKIAPAVADSFFQFVTCVEENVLAIDKVSVPETLSKAVATLVVLSVRCPNIFITPNTNPVTEKFDSSVLLKCNLHNL